MFWGDRSEELKRAHEQREHDLQRVNRAHREFLSRLSHDLRTPLIAILGFAELLQLDDLTPDQTDSVSQIVAGGRHLLDLINEVLDLTRIEAGTLELSIERLNTGDVIRDVVALVSPVAAARDVTVSVPLTYGDGIYVAADPQRIRQVLLTLLSSAVRYNKHGGRVAVECEAAGDRVRILVRDVGAGIPPAKLQLLFTPFEKLGAEDTGVEGTGLGLVLARRLTEAMGGGIHARREAEHGSVFWIELASTEAGAAREGSPERMPVTSAPGIEGLLLYIEDNVSNAQVLQRVLAHRPGVRLIHADDGETALRILKRERPDLILLDLHLPDMPGEELLRRIRGNPVMRSIPVAVLSADAGDAQAKRLLDAGASAYVTKPFNVTRVLALVDETLARRP